MTHQGDETYLAFDLGASSGRAVLGRPNADGSVAIDEVHRFGNGPVTTDAGTFWDIEALFAEMVEGMRIVAARGIAPRAIGVDTWGVDFALLDAAGKLVEPPRSYRQKRIAGLSRTVSDRVGAQRLLDRTGSMHQDHASLCQLLAAKTFTPEVVAAAERLLFIPDLLRYWLCGARGTDCTAASTSQMYDAVGREWATDILAAFDLPAAILPAVGTGPAVVGALSESICERTGLGAVPVTAGCGHDTGAAFGLCRGPHLPDPDDLVVISSGTWAILGVFVDAHLPAGTLDPTRFGYEANPDGSLRIVRNLTGGWLIEQCRQIWAAGGADCSYEALIAAARSAAGTQRASAVLDLAWEGFASPPDMPATIAAHCRDSGQPVPETPGEFSQVIFASLAHAYAEAIAELRSMTGRGLGQLYMIGGMARNAYLNDLTAEAAGVEVLVGPAEATAAGNVACQIEALANA